MRILVHDYAGHPFQAQLSRELARRGHSVVHAYYLTVGKRNGAVERLDGDPRTLLFRPIRLSAAAAANVGTLRRPRHELAYAWALGRVARSLRPDVVISANTPLIAQRWLLSVAHRSGAAFVYWLQDGIALWLTPTIRRHFGRPGYPLEAGLRWLERSSLVGSERVVSISPDFLELLSGYGVPRSNISLIPNWSPVEEIMPTDRHNAWAKEHSLADGFVFLYAGALGMRHDMHLLADLAAAIPAATVMAVTDRDGARILPAEAQRRGLANLRVLPIQAYARLPEVLGAADVLVALLERGSTAVSVPSKVLSYLAAGRPILASISGQSFTASVLRESGAALIAEPGDGDAWLALACELVADPDRRATMAANGRAYAERTFDIGRIGGEFEAAIEQAKAAREGGG